MSINRIHLWTSNQQRISDIFTFQHHNNHPTSSLPLSSFPSIKQNPAHIPANNTSIHNRNPIPHHLLCEIKPPPARSHDHTSIDRPTTTAELTSIKHPCATERLFTAPDLYRAYPETQSHCTTNTEVKNIIPVFVTPYAFWQLRYHSSNTGHYRVTTLFNPHSSAQICSYELAAIQTPSPNSHTPMNTPTYHTNALRKQPHDYSNILLSFMIRGTNTHVLHNQI